MICAALSSIRTNECQALLIRAADGPLKISMYNLAEAIGQFEGWIYNVLSMKQCNTYIRGYSYCVI